MRRLGGMDKGGLSVLNLHDVVYKSSGKKSGLKL